MRPDATVMLTAGDSIKGQIFAVGRFWLRMMIHKEVIFDTLS